MADDQEHEHDDDAVKQGVEELGAYLALEFGALEVAIRQLKDTSDLARAVPEGHLLGALASLRLAGSMDELTASFLDLRDAERDAAESLLDSAAADLEDDYDDDDFDDEDADLDTDDFGALLE